MKLLANIDKLGTTGLFLTALLLLCCFPLFAFAASAIGLGSAELFGGWTMWIFQSMVLLAVGGRYLSYRKHRNLYPLIIGIISGLAVLYGYHINDSDYWTYFLCAGMLGLLVATLWNYQRNKIQQIRKSMTIELSSSITCPNCGHQKTETMPTDTCTYFMNVKIVKNGYTHYQETVVCIAVMEQ